MLKKNKSKSNGNDKKSGGKFEKKKGVWANIGAIWESPKYDGMFMKANGFDGTLLFLARDKEGGEPKLFKITKANVRDRDTMIKAGATKTPESLVCNLSVNLENENNEEIDLNQIESLSELLEDQDSND